VNNPHKDRLMAIASTTAALLKAPVL
jgi:hypothetical protein